MLVKVKKLNENAVIPKYAKDGDAGLDLTATSVKIDEYGNVVYGTGLAFEIPYGYVGLLFPRSSVSKKSIYLTNCTGVLDSGYRGEVMFKFKPAACMDKNNTSFLETAPHMYEVGERIGQLIILPYPSIKLVESDELSSTERGDGGFGSTN